MLQIFLDLWNHLFRKVVKKKKLKMDKKFLKILLADIFSSDY